MIFQFTLLTPPTQWKICQCECLRTVPPATVCTAQPHEAPEAFHERKIKEIPCHELKMCYKNIGFLKGSKVNGCQWCISTGKAFCSTSNTRSDEKVVWEKKIATIPWSHLLVGVCPGVWGKPCPTAWTEENMWGGGVNAWSCAVWYVVIFKSGLRIDPNALQLQADLTAVARYAMPRIYIYICTSTHIWFNKVFSTSPWFTFWRQKSKRSCNTSAVKRQSRIWATDARLVMERRDNHGHGLFGGDSCMGKTKASCDHGQILMYRFYLTSLYRLYIIFPHLRGDADDADRRAMTSSSWWTPRYAACSHAWGSTVLLIIAAGGKPWPPSCRPTRAWLGVNLPKWSVTEAQDRTRINAEPTTVLRGNWINWHLTLAECRCELEVYFSELC